MANKLLRIINEQGKIEVREVGVMHFTLHTSTYHQYEDYGCWYTDKNGDEWYELINKAGSDVVYGIPPALCNQRIISGSTMVFVDDWKDVTCEKCLVLGGGKEALV